jgi:hypothetical protein
MLFSRTCRRPERRSRETLRTCQTFLEFHHMTPYAKQGPSTVANISLRCRRHNQYEAELIFGPRIVSMSENADSAP